MQHVIFTLWGQGETISGSSQVLDDLQQYTRVWTKIDPIACISLQPGVPQALEYAKTLEDEDSEFHVFVTGTTRLVGPVLSALQ